MNDLNRRRLLKLAGLTAIAGFTSFTTYAEASDDVLYLGRGDAVFDQHRQLYNKSLSFMPRVIAVCANEAGVQQAIKYAKAKGLHVTIKSGGHSFEGSCLNNDGLVIDLAPMNNMVLKADNSLVAQPAVKLKQLNDYLLPKGRLLPAGSCGGVGLSGLTLGGGYGLFARQFGLTCDHLTGVRIVTKDGSVIDSDDMPELLWGCKGGGNGRFGVVTELRYRTVRMPATLYQHRFRAYKLTPARAVQLCKSWFDITKSLPNYAFAAYVLNGKTLTVTVMATKNEAMHDVLAKFEAVMDKNDGLKPDPLPIGIKYYYGRKEPLNFKNLSAGYYKGFEDLEEGLEDLLAHSMATRGAVFQINTLGGAINTVDADATAYPHRHQSYLGEAQCYWDKPEQASEKLTAMKIVQKKLHAMGVRDHYVNYPDSNIASPEQAYFGKNLARLKALEKQLGFTAYSRMKGSD